MLVRKSAVQLHSWRTRTALVPRFAGAGTERAPRVRGASDCAVLAVLALSACAGWRGQGDTYYSKGRAEASYSFGMPGDGWQPESNQDGVQVAWIHLGIAGMINIHSECEGHGDSSLAQFTDHLRIDWTEWKVVSQSEERIAGRAALRSIVVAELDGVQFKHDLIVVKKDGCLFDLRYTAVPDSFEQGHSAFDQVVSGFRFPLSGN